jgi:predicted dehydrogenase
MHTSWTQWKNIFRFEVIGRDGYLTVEGLGGSYGPERLTLGHRRPQGGVPYEETWPFDEEDVSWREEWAEFKRAIASGKPPLGSGEDGLRAARVLDAIYIASRTSGWVALTGDPR